MNRSFRLVNTIKLCLIKPASRIAAQQTRKMAQLVAQPNLTFLGQAQAAKIDEELFSKYGFKVEQLMELAGLSCAKALHNFYPQKVGCNVLVLCGPGNNGGDGFVCARHLQLFGYVPSIVYPKESRNDLMKALVQQCEGMDIPVLKSLPEDLKPFDLVVDALFGFSFKPPIREPFLETIAKVNDAAKPILSIDIPSGWDVENGPPACGTFFSPEIVVSLTAPKLCMKFFNGTHYIGGRFVPKALAKEHDIILPEYYGSGQILKYS